MAVGGIDAPVPALQSCGCIHQKNKATWSKDDHLFAIMFCSQNSTKLLIGQLAELRRHRSSVDFRGHIFAPKNRYEKLTKCANFT